MSEIDDRLRKNLSTLECDFMGCGKPAVAMTLCEVHAPTGWIESALEQEAYESSAQRRVLEEELEQR